MLSIFKKRTVILSFIGLLTVTTFLFQNCAKSKIAVQDMGSSFSSLSCNSNGSDVCAAEAAKCSFDGKEIVDGQSIKSYLTSSVPYGSFCSSEERTCQNGVLSGTHIFATCDVGVASACLFNGQTIKHGDTIAAFANSTVSFGKSCVPELRKCDNGSLSNQAEFATCEVGAPMACLFNGQTIKHNASVVAFPTSSVAFDKTCVSETRVCFNGVLSGHNSFASCAADVPKSCLFNGLNVAHGQSVIAYAEAVSANCAKQTRLCNNGTLSGEFTNPSCVVKEVVPPVVENLCAQIRNVQGDMRVYIEPAKTAADFSILEFGTFADNYWAGDVKLGKIFVRELSFDLPTIDAVSEMILTKASYDDWFLLTINGKNVYIGPKGGDRLILLNDGIVQYSADGFSVPELSTSWSFDLNTDIKPFLVQGVNKITTKTIVAGEGESAIKILFKSKNCQ